MIIEIALGIVLAVLILMFLREILALALIALALAIALAVIAVVVYFAFTAPEVFFTLLAILAVFFGFAYWEETRKSKRDEAKKIEAQLKDQTDSNPQS